MKIDRARCLSPLADGPDDKRLPAPHVAGHEHLVLAGAVALFIGHHIAPLVGCDAGLRDHAIQHRSGEADGEEDEIGLDDEFGPWNRLALFVDAGADHARGAAILALDAQGRGLEFTLRAFRLRGGGAHFGRPVGPDHQLVLDRGRLGPDVELGHLQGALPE